jgi:tRNA nucleotidyltransferase (CCA-adding enzyme)
MHISYEQIAAVMGEEATERVALLAQEAEHIGLRFALVGGVVRDVLLNMPTTDYDFLVDGGELGLGAAAELASAVKDRYDGVVKGHAAFGTATWNPPASFTNGDALAPDHYDFASARSEVYERPGALPIPSPTTLEDDLRRRDFTTNAMALMLAPREEFGRVIDPHGGLDDIDAGELRVLHPASFSDDPTRIFRGARLSARLGFAFERRTEALIPRALSAIENVSGERLRTELRLILVESSAADSLALLDEYGALAAIHPALQITETLDDDLLSIHDDPPADLETAAWCAWLCRLDPADIKQISMRLAFTAALASAVNCAAMLVGDPSAVMQEQPSVAYRRLHGLPEPSIIAAGRVLGGAAAHNAEKYLTQWRYVKTVTTGDHLKQLGVPPGPRYKLILQHLLDARLDGHIRSDQDEAAYLRDLIDKLPADESA